MSDALPVTTRLKMRVSSVKLIGGGGGTPHREYLLAPVAGPGNEQWSKWTPSGILQYTVTNPECPDLVLNGEYYVDLVPVPKPEAPPAP